MAQWKCINRIWKGSSFDFFPFNSYLFFSCRTPMYSRWYWCFWLWHFIKTKTNSTHKVELALYQILKNESYDKSKETCCWSACCAAYPPQHVLNFKGWKYKWCESVNPSILTRIFKTAWEFAQPAYMHFMDLEKSNDRIPRDVVWGVLWEYAVLAHYYGLFGLPSVVRAWFVLPTVNQTGSWAGIYQGCPLLKSLFITLMDKIFRHSQGVKGFEISGIRICCCRLCGNVGLIEWWPPTFTLVRSVWSGQDENLHGWTQLEDLGITEWAESRLGD